MTFILRKGKPACIGLYELFHRKIYQAQVQFPIPKSSPSSKSPQSRIEIEMGLVLQSWQYGSGASTKILAILNYTFIS